jgi:iron complex transport system substrate-binding protein
MPTNIVVTRGNNMKYSKIQLVITLVLLMLFLTACTQGEEQATATATLIEPTATSLMSQEEIDAPTEDPLFLIQADEIHQPSITALYQAYFDGMDPVFVETGADLIVKRHAGLYHDRPIVYPTYLWGSYMINESDLHLVDEFIQFAISIEGQEVLDEAGELVLFGGIRDQADNDILIEQPIRRVISTYGPSTAFIYAVGAGDRLVSASYLGARDPLGASIMEKIDPRFPDLMGDDYFTQEDFNIEQAALLAPDLIVTSARTAWLDAAAQLDIPLFLYDAETVERLKEAMLMTGQLFGPNPSAHAEAWVAYFDWAVGKIARYTVDIPEEDRTSVLFTGTQPLRVASGDMFQSTIIELAGGVSASKELTGYWNDIDIEQVAIWDPDVIIVPPYGGATVEAITESPEWQILVAVQEGRVYRMPKLVVPWDTPSPDSVLGIIWMAELLNPEGLELSCSEEAKYFYETFYNYQITEEELLLICQHN